MKKFLLTPVLAALLLAGCKSWNNSQKGGAIGAGGGAVVGGIIGKATGNTALGTIIGAAVGGTAGAVIGRRMDKQAEEIKNEVPGVKVERVGEGIDVELDSKILFAINQSTLSTSALTGLDKLIAILGKYPDTNIEIQGHTDDSGGDQLNMNLSERRAASVAAYLKNKGIAASRITTKGFGETAPKYPNDSEANRASNRRVDFLITANEKMKQDAQTEANK